MEGGISELPQEYKDGSVDFLGCKIDLSKRVLIPRPETEFWVRQAIVDLQKIAGEIHVLDIFSGSGCVGIAAAKKNPRAMIDFIDIGKNEIGQIKINLEINVIDKKRVCVIKSNTFENVPHGTVYDAILANPPYIDPERINEVQGSVLDYEPRQALFGGTRGLEVIEKFLKTARNFLKPLGFIYLEFDPSQIGEVEKIIKKNNYSSFEFFKDQFEQWRFAKIIK